MRLEYKVLWIEDSDSWYNQEVEIIKHCVEDLGFIFLPDRKSTSEDLDDVDLGQYDLMLVDFNLGPGDYGNRAIEKIRNGERFTEIVFYSQSGIQKLQESLSTHLDGIYLSDRNDGFEDKVMGVIRSTVRKVLDINNMRGIVMAETSDFDLAMREMIRRHYEKLESDDQKASLVNDICRRINKSLKGKGNKTKQYYEQKNIRVIDDLIFESSLKWRTLKKILEARDGVPNEIKEAFEAYWEEVADHRNHLAHVSEQQDGKGGTMLVGNGREYDDGTFLAIRKNIIRHRCNMERIREALGVDVSG